MSRWINLDQSFLPHAAAAVGIAPTPTAMVVSEFDGISPVALVVFDGYNGSSVHVHIWIAPDRRAGRAFWYAVYCYAFHQLAVRNAIGTVPASNLAARKLNERMGFVLNTVVPGYYPDGDDMLLYIMTPHTAPNWRSWERKEIADGR